MRLPPDVPTDKALLDAVAKLDKAERVAFWHAQTVDRRLEAVELQRQIDYNYDPATARIVKVCVTVSLHDL